MVGTTSACAENTATGSAANPQSRNYLRVRGEYLSATVPAEAFDELPPRARRILGPGRGRRRTLGTTSACAENTPGAASRSCAIWNYLRVRGEYPISRNRKGSLSELPPRARRIPRPMRCQGTPLGTTSACAENTRTRRLGSCATGNYLRVRGEYMAAGMNPFPRKELPPRARRIRKSHSLRSGLKGTTSACAENTCDAS